MKIEVPVEWPSAERIEQLIREEARAVAREQVAWLTFQEAAEHVRMPYRTFERKKKLLGLPVSIIDGVKRIARWDLDQAMIGHMDTTGLETGEGAPFPSLRLLPKQRPKQLREEEAA